MKFKTFLVFGILLLGSMCNAFGNGSDTLRYRFYFPTGSSELNPALQNNGNRLDSLISCIRSRRKCGSIFRLDLLSGSSPEGRTDFNNRLSEKRLASLLSAIRKHVTVSDSVLTTHSAGENWDGLYSLVEKSEIPYRNEAMHIIGNTPVWIKSGGIVRDSRKRQLMNLCGGSVWSHMKEHFFPMLREVSATVCVSETVVPEKCAVPRCKKPELNEKFISYNIGNTLSSAIHTGTAPDRNIRKSHLIGLKTNLLYDALLVPNIGVEFHLGKGWSVGGNWMYAWWKKENAHRFWRVYGGEIGIRKYLSQKTDKPATGHHIGIYGQMITYDFEFGGKGYMGGKPGGSLWDKSNYGAGLEYGYSLSVAKRLNLDFSLGIGYWGGTYYKYAPADDIYVWKEIKKRHWFGPTKAEISLVWLLEWGGEIICRKGGKQ